MNLFLDLHEIPAPSFIFAGKQRAYERIEAEGFA